MLDRHLCEGNDLLARAAGFHWRRYDTDRLRYGLFDFSQREAIDYLPRDRARGDAGAHHRPHRWRLSDRPFSWHWLFLVNVVPGILVTAAAWFLIDFDKPNLKILRQFDWFGFFTMAGFLGALEYVLEEGPTDNWFDSNAITMGAISSVVCAIVFFWRALTEKDPIVDLSSFKDRNFWTGSMFSFVLGIGLYGLTYLILSISRACAGFPPCRSARPCSSPGFACSSWRPFQAPLCSAASTRGSCSLWDLQDLRSALGRHRLITKDWDFYEFLVPQILRGISLMLVMIPITNSALGTMPPQKLKNASGLFNLTRNLGGAVGLALSTRFSTSGSICTLPGCMSRSPGGGQRRKKRLQS